MSARTPIVPVALLTAAVLAIVLPGDPAGLLLLTPALALLLPLLASVYPAEKAVHNLATWISRVRIPAAGGSGARELTLALSSFNRDGFAASNGSRGPPLPSPA